MPVIVRQDDVVPHENDQRRIWRLITPSTVGAALIATAGVVAYKSRSSSVGAIMTTGTTTGIRTTTGTSTHTRPWSSSIF
jgi:hypothetical protein